ncbi:MAG: 2OG-Fe(II) oxygenase [Pseudomonadales bacterium]
MTNSTLFDTGLECGDSTLVHEKIAKGIYEQGYAVLPNALPIDLANALAAHVQSMPAEQFKQAGIGRDQTHALNEQVRTDEVCWISDDFDAGRAWLDWASELQVALNRRLFLGLFSFESHFAHYAPGNFYKRHLDAFKGESNRVLSLVVYLNPDWQPEYGGELVIEVCDAQHDAVKLTPSFGTVVVFLSEEFPHEVLPASHDRYSIAGWFRLNTSSTERVDPPE